MEEWIRENWFFILFFILFIWMHLSGHGCGGHGGHGHGKENGHDKHFEKNKSEREDQ
ncbi:MAG: hypothetical protein Q7J01_01260 [Syntrophales bacterium]|nr:hypothetical protein [Syntrophales bacterium]